MSFHMLGKGMDWSIAMSFHMLGKGVDWSIEMSFHMLGKGLEAVADQWGFSGRLSRLPTSLALPPLPPPFNIRKPDSCHVHVLNPIRLAVHGRNRSL